MAIPFKTEQHRLPSLQHNLITRVWFYASTLQLTSCWYVLEQPILLFFILPKSGGMQFVDNPILRRASADRFHAKKKTVFRAHCIISFAAWWVSHSLLVERMLTRVTCFLNKHGKISRIRQISVDTRLWPQQQSCLRHKGSLNNVTKRYFGCNFCRKNRKSFLNQFVKRFCLNVRRLSAEFLTHVCWNHIVELHVKPRFRSKMPPFKRYHRLVRIK